MKIWGFVLCLCVISPAFGAPLNDELSSTEGRALLDQTSKTQQTFNQITLLKQGMNSWPVRKKLIEEAQDFIFISVPFWNYDSTGTEFIQWLEDKRASNPNIDMRVVNDWICPVYCQAGMKVKDNVHTVVGDDHLLLWNNPLWQRNFSLDLERGHVHDKLLVVDGKKMIVGGLNITDADSQGGLKPVGDFDMDMEIEGPAVSEATRTFLKIDQLGHYLSSSADFPPFADEEITAFNTYFYNDQDDHDFTEVTSDPDPKPPFVDTFKVHIPVKELMDDLRFFPTPKTGDVGLRFIYDNALLDRDVKTHQHTSKYFETLKAVASKAKSSLWISTPYLTPDQEQMAFLLDAAKRLDVRLVTNSVQATDETQDYYKGQLSHYLTYLKAGIKLYEWQGQADLQKLSDQGCKVDYWPGFMIHAKMAMADSAAVFIGSNNTNHRSKDLNNEIMIFVNDEKWTQQIVPIFQNLFAGFPQSTSCTEGNVQTNMVKELDVDSVTALMKQLNVTKEIWSYPHGG